VTANAAPDNAAPDNAALASNGSTATASSTLSPYVPAYVINGSRRATNSSVWLDSTYNSFPDWVQVDFNGSKTISEIDVITQQDDPQIGGNATDEELRRRAGDDRDALRAANKIINRRNDFRNALTAAGRARDALPAGAERDLVSASLASYGAEGVANGVSVGQGRLADGVAAEARTAYFPFENGTFTAQVEVVLSDRRGGNLAVDVAHEGRHVADAQEFAAALTRDVAANGGESTIAIMGDANRTRYDREVRGYTVSSLVAQGLGLDNLSVGRREIWNRGWSQADRATLRSAAINNYLRESNTYRLTPENPGQRYIPRP